MHSPPILLKNYSQPTTPGRRAVGSWPPSPTFLRSKKENGKQRKKRKSLKEKPIKRLSPRSKYHCFSHSRASRIQKYFYHGGRQYVSVFHGSSTLKFISPAMLVTCFSVFSVFNIFRFEFDVIFIDFFYNVCEITVYIGTKRSVILFSPSF